MKRHSRIMTTALAACWASPLLAGQVRWTPEAPILTDTLRISVESAVPPDVLHWGVNGTKSGWITPAPELRPPGTETTDSTAVNTAFTGQEGQSVWQVDLGPFDASTQTVHTLRFVIRLKDGSWLNNQGDNYTVDISAGRIRFAPEPATVHDRIRVEVLDSPGPGMLRWGVNEGRNGWKPPHPVYRPEGTTPVGDGFAVETPLPEPDAEGVSVVHLGPFNLGEQVVTSLHAVARWGAEWDTESGRNYNLAIALPPPDETATGLRANLPERVVRGLAGQTATASASAETLELYLDGASVAAAHGPDAVIRHPLEALGYGPHEMTVRAVAADGSVDLASGTVWVVPDTVTGEPAGPIEPGAHALGDGRVRFAVHAPGKRFVSVVGDFNGWNPTSHFMNVSADGTWWLDVALPGGTYRYQYRVDGERQVGDPAARLVDWKDASGRPGWRAADAKAVLRTGQPDYPWTAGNYRRPDLDQLLIYEFHIGDMQEGGYTGMIDKLDYIVDLGFTALGPMPFTEFAGEHSWGYNPSYYFAPEASYGTPEELKALIDAAHARGLAVIKDIVLNHMDYASALYQLYGSDYEASPYFRLFDGENWGFPDVEQQTPAWKRHAADALAWWLTEYRIDGFRYDATRFTEWSGYNDWGASWFAYAGKQVDPESIHISEHLPEDPALQNTTEMDTTWHAHFRWRIREMLENATLDPNLFMDVIDPTRLGFTNALQRIAYTESHDEERVMRLLTEKGYTGDEAVRRAEAALGLTLTAPGPAMIYAGQEFGENTWKVVGENPIQWALLDTPAGQRLHAFTRAAARLRTSHPALRATEVAFLHEGLPGQVGGYLRGPENAPRVAVLVNFGSQPEEVSRTALPEGSWTDGITHEPVSAERLPLAPGEIRILVQEG